MKKIKIYLFAFIAVLLGFACEDDKEQLVLDTDNMNPSILLTPANESSYTLTFEMLADTFEVFEWTKADYGVTLSQEFTLQLDPLGTTFEEVEMLYRGVDTKYKFTNAELNLLLYDYGHRGSSDAYFRVMTAIKKTAIDTLISDVNSVSVNLYEYNKPAITEPIDASDYVLLKEQADDDFKFVWDEVKYGGDFNDRYELQVDVAGNDFANAKKITKVFSEYSYTSTISELNDILVGLDTNSWNVAMDFEFRVYAEASSKSGVVISDPITLSIQAYNKDADPNEPPEDQWPPTLYVIGDATTIDWDNNAALPMTRLSDGVYELVTNLDADAGEGFKFLETLGQWAPMYGQDGEGTWSEGNLTYRPKETDTDPSSIPPPDVTGDYKIEVDLNDLSYQVTLQ